MLGNMNARATGPIAMGSPYYSADVEKYDFNLGRATKLLDDAGLKPGANGVRMTLDIDAIPEGGPAPRGPNDTLRDKGEPRHVETVKVNVEVRTEGVNAQCDLLKRWRLGTRTPLTESGDGGRHVVTEGDCEAPHVLQPREGL